MFLSKLFQRKTEDRGSGLIAVIGLAAVTAIIGVTVGAVTVHSLQTTNGVAGSVEARAAAQAGVAQAELLLRTRNADGSTGCPSTAVVTSTGNPSYEVKIFTDNLANGWTATPTCPGVNATRVKFVATGLANRGTPGAGASGGEVVVEAIYQFIPEYTNIPAIDPAVYAYQITGSLSQFTLGIEANTVIQADIQIKNGDFICQNDARVSGSVILANGKAELKSCAIDGNLHVSRTVELGRSGTNSSTVRDNLIAAGVSSTGTPLANPVVFLDRGTTVGRDVFSGGDVVMNAPQTATVRGNVTAARNTSTVVSIAAGARVDGNVLTTGTITGPAGTVGGTRSPGVAGLQPPSPPVVPNWIDLPFTTSTIQSSTWWGRGFQNVVTWSGDCTLTGNNPRWAALATYTQKTIIDATACSSGVVVDSNLSSVVSLMTDIVFFSKSFSFTKLPAQASNLTDARRLYFIVPDNTPNALPTCSGGAGNITYNNETNINAPLALFFYSPCSVISDRNNMRGQIYGGSVEFRQQAQWTFVPATPPGVNFSTGNTTPVLTGAFLGDRLTLREITSGG